MDSTGKRGNGFEAFMVFMIGLASIGASISFHFTGF
jgi:hypothetical protein